MITRVVVPLDGSELATRALGPARALADRTGASLLLLTTNWAPYIDDLRGYMKEQADRLEFERAETMIVRNCFAAPAILAQQGEPGSFLCMSTHGRGGLRHALLGSIAEEVVRSSDQPIMLVGPGLEPDVWRESARAFAGGKLLVTVDESDVSMAIVPVAAEWAGLFDLEPWVVQVVPPTPEPEVDPTSELTRVRRIAESLVPEGRRAGWDVLHAHDAADALLDYAKQLPASLVAMATHGRSGVARVALGSTAMNVVRSSPSPVIVQRSAPPASAG